MAHLECRHTETGERWTAPISGQPIEIGRSRTADVSIRDVSVSKAHVRIERRGGRYWFEDLRSRNGTYINDLRQDSGPFTPGDVLRVGKILVTLRRGERDVASDPPARVGTEPRTSSASTRGGAGLGLTEAKPAASRAETDEDFLEETLQSIFETPTPRFASPPAPPAPPPRRRQADAGPLVAGAAVLGMIVGAVPAFYLGRAYAPSRGVGGSGGTEAASTEDPAAPPNAASAAVAALEEVARAGSPLAAADDAPGAARTTHPAGRPGVPEPPAAFDPVAAILGPRADLGDPEVAGRALTRLALDLAGRPLTRAEAAELRSAGRDEQWRRITEIAAGHGAIPSIAAAARRFLHVELTPEDERRLALEISSDPAAVAREIVASRHYADASFRRPREGERLATSLWVDLRDEVPTAENTRTVLRALDDTKLSDVVRILVHSSAMSPRDDAEIEDWIGDAFARLLLRAPSGTERTNARAEIVDHESGWKWVLQDLALRPEYQAY